MGELIPSFNPPFSGSIPIYAALALLTFSLALLAAFLWRRVYRIIRRLRGRPVARTGIISSTFRLLLILLMLAISSALLFLVAFIQSYTAFTHRDLVAVVHCTPVPSSRDEMMLELVTFEPQNTAHGRLYRLRGQQWAIEGHIVKWDDWLNFVGLRTMYKLTRVRGRYVRVEDETSKPPAAHSLVTSEESPQWRWLYEYGAQLPFVKSVYGNVVFTYPSETKTFQVYATTSGLMIEEQEQEP